MTARFPKVLCTTPRFKVVEIEAADIRYESDYYIEKSDGVSIALGTDSVILMLEIGRRKVDGSSLEFPGGRIEVGESPLEAAERELLEETGISCTSLRPVGQIAPLPGIVSERVHLFQGCISPAEIPQVTVDTGHEGILRSRMIPIADLPALCAEGQISSAVDAYFALRLALHAGGGTGIGQSRCE